MRITVGFLWFVAPALIVNAQEEAKAKRKKLLQSAARNLLQSEDRTVPRTSLKQLSTLNEFLKVAGKEILIFRKNELGLEIVIQLVVQFLMLLLSPTYTTHTATHSGLQAIFETDYTSTAKMASEYVVKDPLEHKQLNKSSNGEPNEKKIKLSELLDDSAEGVEQVEEIDDDEDDC